jgi:hypothetical protein
VKNYLSRVFEKLSVSSRLELLLYTFSSEKVLTSAPAQIAPETKGQPDVRAECVMLNKGPYIVKALRALDDILRRMEGHHRKSRSTLRKLRLAELFSLPHEGSEAALAS